MRTRQMAPSRHSSGSESRSGYAHRVCQLSEMNLLASFACIPRVFCHIFFFSHYCADEIWLSNVLHDCYNDIQKRFLYWSQLIFLGQPSMARKCCRKIQLFNMISTASTVATWSIKGHVFIRRIVNSLPD